MLLATTWNDTFYFIMGAGVILYALIIIIRRQVSVGLRFCPRTVFGASAVIVGVIYLGVGVGLFYAGLQYQKVSTRDSALLIGLGALGVLLVANFLALLVARSD